VIRENLIHTGHREHLGRGRIAAPCAFLVSLLVWVLCAVLTSRRSLAPKNLDLRQQLAAYTRTQKRPRIKPGERAFWVALSKVWRDWRLSLVLVKPATMPPSRYLRSEPGLAPPVARGRYAAASASAPSVASVRLRGDAG
jgi:hypothetical protein